MALTLSSSTPANGATDTYINTEIRLVFNKAVAFSSVSSNTISLIDRVTGDAVPVTFSVNPVDAAEIIVNPTNHLKENTNYRVNLVGSDFNIGYNLSAEDAEDLVATVSVNFSTGDNVYEIDTAIEKEAASLTLEGDLSLPSNIKALGEQFTIQYVDPLNNTHGAPVTLNGSNQVDFHFSRTLATGQDNYDIWAEVSILPIVSEYYFVTGTTFNKDDGIVSLPTYTVAPSGEHLLITFEHELPKNAGLVVRLTDKIISSEGDYYGGKAWYSINTECYPDLVPVYACRRELNSINAEFYDDYIGAMILKNTIALQEMGLNSGHHYSRYLYVLSATIIDLIDDKDLEKFIVSGTRRQLGDLNTSVDVLTGRISLKRVRAERDLQKALDSLKPGWQINTGSYAAYGTIAADINRLWYNANGRYTSSEYKYYQSNHPVNNISLNRAAKTNNPFWL